MQSRAQARPTSQLLFEWPLASRARLRIWILMVRLCLSTWEVQIRSGSGWPQKGNVVRARAFAGTESVRRVVFVGKTVVAVCRVDEYQQAGKETRAPFCIGFTPEVVLGPEARRSQKSLGTQNAGTTDRTPDFRS